MQKITKILSIFVRIVLAAALLGYLVYSGSIDWDFLAGLFSAWYFSLAAIAGFILVHMVLAWRLQILLQAHDLVLAYWPAFRLTLIGLFFNTYLPGAQGGDLIKIYYASKGNPGKRTEIITIMIFDRLVGMFSLFVAPVIIAPFFYDVIAANRPMQGLLLITSGASVAVVVSVIIGMRMDVEHGRFFVWLYNKIPKGEFLRRILVTIHSYRHNSKKVLFTVALSIAMQTLVIGSMLFIAAAITPGGADTRMALLVPMGFLATALPVTPGGIGVGEAALDSLFKLFDLHGGAELLLGWRVLMVIIGMLGLYYYLRAGNRFVHHEKTDN